MPASDLEVLSNNSVRDNFWENNTHSAHKVSYVEVYFLWMSHRNSEVIRTKYHHDISLIVMDNQTKNFDWNIFSVI